MKRQQRVAHAVTFPIWFAVLGSLQPTAALAQWQLVVDDGFGVPENHATGAMAVFEQQLYVGTYSCGPLWLPPFQVWRTEGRFFADGFESGDTSAWSATVP